MTRTVSAERGAQRMTQALPATLHGATIRTVTTAAEFRAALRSDPLRDPVPSPEWEIRGVLRDSPYDLAPKLQRMMREFRFGGDVTTIPVQKDLSNLIEDGDMLSTRRSPQSNSADADTSHIWAFMQHYGSPTHLLAEIAHPQRTTYSRQSPSLTVRSCHEHQTSS